jgi:hypothetical protein
LLGWNHVRQSTNRIERKEQRCQQLGSPKSTFERKPQKRGGKANPGDYFLVAEFEVIQVLPAINPHCIAALNNKCSNEVTQAAHLFKHNAGDAIQQWACGLVILLLTAFSQGWKCNYHRLLESCWWAA